ncbi:MAG: hypothetical protein Q7S82_01630 [bacterium]|nr:hypothetical protein [bacterium]
MLHVKISLTQATSKRTAFSSPSAFRKAELNQRRVEAKRTMFSS